MDQARPAQAEESNGFGDWDIRKEQNVRPKVEENTFENVERKNSIPSAVMKYVRMMTTNCTPPFFRRKR